MDSKTNNNNYDECKIGIQEENDKSVSKIIALFIFICGLVMTIISSNFIEFDLTAISTTLFWFFISVFLMTLISFLYLMIEH